MARAIRLIAQSEADRDRAAIDQYSPAVFVAGAAAGLLGLSTELVVFGSLALEVAQAWPPTKDWMKRGDESLANKTADTVLFLLGYWLGKEMQSP